MSAAAKQHRKELATCRAQKISAVQAERDRCAKIAEAFQQRALDDGMIAHADAGKWIAVAIRGGANGAGSGGPGVTRITKPITRGRRQHMKTALAVQNRGGGGH